METSSPQMEQSAPAISPTELSNGGNTEIDFKNTARTLANAGAYTCTYLGCTLRFETTAKLQRHKRKSHSGSGSQNGPHKCERINPSTGEPCNTSFSRPYDLTRHEDTIHNAGKQNNCCHLCTERFGRKDTLTRHFRIRHPQVESQKIRRRKGRD